ncbi:MAG: hypothetical protein KGL39_46650 [Patescibacteria group bacterium]|nr:hypothetical protein [Patescibacteria group bacterium]
MHDSLQHIGGMITGLVVGVITLAIIAVIVSKRADTANVIGSSGGALANVIAAAVSPITGNSVAPNTGSGGGGSFPFLSAAPGLGNPLSLLSNNSFGSAL